MPYSKWLQARPQRKWGAKPVSPSGKNVLYGPLAFFERVHATGLHSR